VKITFFSNFLNHHQLPFCLEMFSKLGDNFKFVATEPIHEERLAMGYSDMSEMYPFTLNTYTSENHFNEGVRLGNESDIVIIGSAPEIFIRRRIIENKLTFRYSERIFKRGKWRVLSPRTLLYLLRNHTRYRNKKLYLLCASAYTAADFNLVGAYKNKTFKWGYFPEVKELDIKQLFLKKKNSVPKLIWVGRFLDWKHPEQAVFLADKLRNQGYKFTLDIIGTGLMEEEIKNLIKKYQLEDVVKLLGSMKPEEVREHMDLANIHLFTSDFNEGWGAVLNESMNSGCAVVASNAIGAVPFLMTHEKNGLIYKNGDMESLLKCVKMLMDDKSLVERFGKVANKTLTETWNAKVAVERLILLSESLLKGKETSFKEGPCSKALIIPEGYTY
jgi:glycosyltransferase involved in cell wall biosynthesis